VRVALRQAGFGGRGGRAGRWLAALALVTLLVAGAAPSAPASPFDQTPDPTWQTNGRVRTIVYTPNAIYIGGEFTQVIPPRTVGGDPVPRNHVAAFDATTGDLLPWNPNADGFVWSLDVSGSTVYLGGQFTHVGGRARAHAAAVDATSGAILPWNPRPDSKVYAVKVGPDGNIYLGGFFAHVAGQPRALLAAVAPDGTATAWNPIVEQVSGSTCPPRCTPYVAALTFSPDGSTLYFGGHFGIVNGIGRNNAAAVTVATGQLLPWNPSIFGAGAGKNAGQANKVWHIELGPDRAYICGDYWAIDGFQRHANLAAVDLSGGHLIRSFDATTDGATPGCTLIGNTLYAGGHFQNVGPNGAWVFNPGQKAHLNGPGAQVRNHLAAFDATTGAIDPWNPFVNSELGIHSMTAIPTQLFVGGDFTQIGTVTQQGFGRFSFDTTPPDTLLDTGPPAVTDATSATFTFRSTEKSSLFTCSLDGGAFAPCTTPATYTGLADGSHTFQVAAIDPAGNVDPTPASDTWTVDTTAPSPPTGLDAVALTSTRALVTWTASPDPDVASYQVYRDGSLIGETTVTSFTDTALAGPATYSYTARAVDQAGNVSGDSDPFLLDAPPATPPLFQDDFESGDLSNWTASSGLLVQTQEVHDGTYAARATTTGAPAYASKQLTSTLGELYYKTSFELLSQTTIATLLRFESTNGLPLVSLYVNTAGHLGYRNERTATNVNGAAVVSPGWHDLQARVLVNGASSEVEVWLDGVHQEDLTRTESLGSTPIGRIVLGNEGTGKTFDAVFDDVAAGQGAIPVVREPGAPVSVTATAGNGSATVSWSPPTTDGGSAITGYSVTSSPAGGTATVDGATTSTTVSGLTNGVTYTFTVTATNAVGTGPPSAASNAVEPTGAPAAPTAVAAAPGQASAIVSWTPPATDGGSPITGYTVTSSPAGGVVSVDGSTTTATVTGLTNGTSYTFTVTATNALGTGPPSAPSNTVSPRAPATTSVTVSDSGFAPASVTIVQGDTVKWSFAGPGSHSASDSGLGLFDSGLLGPGSQFSYAFFASGRYTISDAGSANTAAVTVPIRIFPTAGTLGTLFAVAWATQDAPVGYAYDVQIEGPGATAFTGWRSNVRKGVGTFSSNDLNFSGTGTYLFRARIRNTNTGVASNWSSVVSISIT
jgi:plastocyanin